MSRLDKISYDLDVYYGDCYTKCLSCGNYLGIPTHDSEYATCQTNVRLVILKKTKSI